MNCLPSLKTCGLEQKNCGPPVGRSHNEWGSDWRNGDQWKTWWEEIREHVVEHSFSLLEEET